MKWPRWMHKLYADTFGYFWLPCPRCHRMSGGHEDVGGSIYLGRGVSQSTCPRCKIGHQRPNDLEQAPFTVAQINEVYRRAGHA